MLFDLIFLFLTLFTDLYTKHIAFTKIFINGITEFAFIPGFITLESAYNKGAAFGSFSGSLFLIKILPTIISIAFIAVYIYFKIINFKEKKKNGVLTPKYKIFATSILNLSLVFLFGGSLGNLYDRFFIKDGVRDFIRYDFIETVIKKPFAIGNVADIYIIIGVILLIIYFIKLLFLTEKENDSKTVNM